MIVSIEQHVDRVTDAIQHLDRKGLRTMEATLEAQDAWVAHVSLIASYTLYVGSGRGRHRSRPERAWF